MPADPFDLDRFVTAQAPVFETAIGELEAGRKRSHWMWFVFPQLRGLGHSSTAKVYGLGSIEEARAYLGHPVLGPRLEQCTHAVVDGAGSSLATIFGSPDDMKFRSSMTLFALAAGEGGTLYRRALERFCAGRPDEATPALLATDQGGTAA